MAAHSQTVKVFMSPRPLFKRHETTCFEYDIPEELEKKISKYVDKLVSKYKSSCNCERCRYEKGRMSAKEEQKIRKDWDEYYNSEFKLKQLP